MDSCGESWCATVERERAYQNQQNQQKSSKHFATPVMAIISLLRQTIVFGFLDFTPMLRGHFIAGSWMAVLD
jgi:hypothetical protein